MKTFFESVVLFRLLKILFVFSNISQHFMADIMQGEGHSMSKGVGRQ